MSGAAVCWAVGTILFKRFLGGRDVYMASGWAFLFAGILASVTVLATGSFTFHSDPRLWWWLAYTILGGSVITNAIWFQLLRREDAAVAATQLFMTPLFSMLFGWLLLSEHPGPSQLAGAGFVALGIVLVNRVRPNRDLEGDRPLSIPRPQTNAKRAGSHWLKLRPALGPDCLGYETHHELAFAVCG
jgi:drug/metabolite transporter (DMT)-like permease